MRTPTYRVVAWGLRQKESGCPGLLLWQCSPANKCCLDRSHIQRRPESSPWASGTFCISAPRHVRIGAMPFLATLLRALLILVLVSNGIGSAYASTWRHEDMGRSRAGQVPARPGQLPAGSSSCPDHHDDMATKPTAMKSTGMKPTVIEQTSASHAPLEHPHGSSDCCDPSNCTCPCMHGCAALPLLAPRMSDSTGRDPGTPHPSHGHPSPALPQLIRPPIA